jgi:hypothetical protein
MIKSLRIRLEGHVAGKEKNFEKKSRPEISNGREDLVVDERNILNKYGRRV